MVSIYSANYLLWAYCVVGFVPGPNITEESIVVAQVRVDRGLKACGSACKSNIVAGLVRIADRVTGR